MGQDLKVKRDILEDLEEADYLFGDYIDKLINFKRQLNRTKKHLPEDIYLKCQSEAEKIEKELIKYKTEISLVNRENLFIEKIWGQKYRYHNILRFTSINIGSLIISTDWQSPSFLHSETSIAGRQTGQIIGTINDYKRDVHLDEKKYEESFLKEYIDARFKLFLHSYLTNSGQAAFQTILTYLTSEKKITGKIIVGKNSYFQYKQILKGTFGNNIIEVSEDNLEEIILQIKNSSSSAIFLDSLCNCPTLVRPDIQKIMNYIYKEVKRNMYIVIDNTCLSIFCQPFAELRVNPFKNKVHLITFESLNKYHQFGLDRVTSGIITSDMKDAGGIFEYRKHTGTNITDASVYTLPTPNRFFLKRRLIRHQRNALVLAKFLSNSVYSDKIDEIIYPAVTKNNSDVFAGSFLNIKFNEKYDNKKNMNKLINLVINEAGKLKVNIVAGTSFGLNTTRIYLTSLYNRYGTPFLRISMGTEDLGELEKIKNVFKEAIKKF